MSQEGNTYVTGYICRKGDGFFYSFTELGYSPIIKSETIGAFYLFQTR